MYPSRLYHAGSTVLRTWGWGLGLVGARTGARAGAEADGLLVRVELLLEHAQARARGGDGELRVERQHDEPFDAVALDRLERVRGERVPVPHRHRCVETCNNSATSAGPQAGPHGRTPAPQWALSGSAARPQCAVQPGERGRRPQKTMVASCGATYTVVALSTGCPASTPWRPKL
eukprot:scaffold15548_cov40-Phaeocystis_antarctica.AAC.1